MINSYICHVVGSNKAVLEVGFGTRAYISYYIEARKNDELRIPECFNTWIS